jgi:hypothetical protein
MLDWTHLYIWIVKDLSWTQNWFYVGCLSAAAAFCVSCFCVARSWWAGGSADTFVHCMTFLWLFANAVWMYGEISDANFPEQPSLYENCRSNACAIMLFTLIAMGVYYIQRCRRQFCGDRSEGDSRTLQAVEFVRVPRAVSTDYSSIDPGCEAIIPNEPVVAQSAAAATVAGESRAPDALHNQRELRPRPFLRRLFPTWRDYEHVHVSRLSSPALFAAAQCNGMTLGTRARA